MAYKELIGRCLEGETKAQRSLYDQLSPTMYGVCLRYCTNSQDAQDAMQEGFIRMFNHLGKYKETGSFEGWVRRIMVNCSLTIIQKRKKRQSQNIDEQLNVAVDPSAINSMSADELMEIIGRLPSGYKTVFLLNVVDGYSHQEIGKMLEIKESTSRSQLMKARRMLQTLLGENEKITS